jgi:hypothetical protein
MSILQHRFLMPTLSFGRWNNYCDLGHKSEKLHGYRRSTYRSMLILEKSQGTLIFSWS